METRKDEAAAQEEGTAASIDAQNRRTGMRAAMPGFWGRRDYILQFVDTANDVASRQASAAGQMCSVLMCP
jgi:hypothetical protein